MGYMNFKNPMLETIFKRFKWTRNNTIEIFETAQKAGILDYTSSTKISSHYTFQPLLFQFQCIVTTTSTYYRKVTNNSNQQFGIYVNNDNVIQKKDLRADEIKKILAKQIEEWQLLLKEFDEKKTAEYMEEIMAVSNHEYLHQGQMIVDFREAGIELPERYKKAWAL